MEGPERPRASPRDPPPPCTWAHIRGRGFGWNGSGLGYFLVPKRLRGKEPGPLGQLGLESQTDGAAPSSTPRFADGHSQHSCAPPSLRQHPIYSPSTHAGSPGILPILQMRGLRHRRYVLKVSVLNSQSRSSAPGCLTSELSPTAPLSTRLTSWSPTLTATVTAIGGSGGRGSQERSQ